MRKKYTIVQDTRERKPFMFRSSASCKGIEKEALPTGDYTLRGYEDIFVIERKGRISEWAQNVIDDRFYRELNRLSEFKHPYVLLEFDMKDIIKYPASSKIPRKKWRYIKMKGPMLLRKTLEMIRDYDNIKFIFCGDYGIDVATSIFKRIVESG